jgi:hypothetical protein
MVHIFDNINKHKTVCEWFNLYSDRLWACQLQFESQQGLVFCFSLHYTYVQPGTGAQSAYAVVVEGFYVGSTSLSSPLVASLITRGTVSVLSSTSWRCAYVYQFFVGHCPLSELYFLSSGCRLSAVLPSSVVVCHILVEYV